MLKRVFAAVVAVLFVVGLVGCSSDKPPKNMPEAAFYNTIEKKVLHIGMDKAELESYIGEPSEEDSVVSIYGDYAFYASYGEDYRVEQLMISIHSDPEAWLTKRGIAKGASEQAVLGAYGKPDEIYEEDYSDEIYVYKLKDGVTMEFIMINRLVAGILITTR